MIDSPTNPIIFEKDKDGSFKFEKLIYNYLLYKSDSGFLAYRTCNMILGRRFCFNKHTTKQVLVSFKQMGLLKFAKRGVYLYVKT